MDEALRDRWLARAHERLGASGRRLGTARKEVLETMASDGQCLIGAQEVVARVRDGGGVASQASVYRVLDELVDLGLIRRLADEHGGSRFEIADPAGGHHHLVDEDTGAVSPFHDRELEGAIQRAAGRLGIELTEHEVLLRGRRRPGS